MGINKHEILLASQAPVAEYQESTWHPQLGFNLHLLFKKKQLQGGPLPGVSKVLTPFIGVLTPVTHL